MFEKLLLLLMHGKGLVLVGVLTTGVVITGTFGGTAIDLVIRPLSPLAFPTDPLVVVDAPRLGEDVRLSPTLAIEGETKLYTVSGYAVDRNGTQGTGISTVELFLDGTKLGDATLALPSPDVAAEFRTDEQDTRFDAARWEFEWDVAALARGTHALRVLARSAGDTARSTAVTIEVGDPLVGFSKPDAGSTVNGNVPLAGWALDRYAPEGTASAAQIEKVELFLDGAKLGDATLDLASPKDIAERYGVAAAGWEYTWDATAVAVGEYTLMARAHSAAQPGSWNEATVLVVVEAPQAEGNGCGWLVGTARGAAVQTLQAGWEGFHSSAQAYRGRMETVDKTKREAFSADVDVTKTWLGSRRDQALGALHAKAEEYLRLCEAGQLPPAVTVTYPQEVISTSHLIYEYRTIVDQAMVDMSTYYESRKTVLDTY